MTVRERAGSTLDDFVNAVGTRLDGSPFAVMLDIDGTLSAIAPRPEEATISEPTRAALKQLVAAPGVVLALVTGRSADDGWRLAGVEGAWVIGNHGLELRTPEGQASANDDVREYESAVSEAARRLACLERTIAGTIVENKRWTLSVHYRLVRPDSVPTLVEHTRGVARQLGLGTMEGKMILEVRPPVRIDKGTATVAFAERVGATRDGASVLYAGDDRTDEDAFRELKAAMPRAVTVRIWAPGEDLPEAQTDAEFGLASPDEVRRVLDWLLTRRLRVKRA